MHAPTCGASWVLQVDKWSTCQEVPWLALSSHALGHQSRAEGLLTCAGSGLPVDLAK